MDVVDDAQRLEAEHLARALAAQQQRAQRHELPMSADGRCLECGDPIGEARLRALPFTGRCIECASVAELRLKGAR